MSDPGIAFVTPVMPADAGNGLAMRAGLFLEGLAAAGPVHVVVVPVFGGASGQLTALARRLAAAIDVVALEDEPDPVAEMIVRLGTAAGRARAAAAHPLPRPSSRATAAAAARVAHLTASAALIHVHRLYLAPFLDAVLDRRDRPRMILDVDDIESSTHRRLGRSEEAARFARLEAHYLPLFDRVVTCSADDARDLVGRYAIAGATPIPNAVRLPPGSASHTPAPPTPAYDLVFVGNLSYPPNVAGARWLCRSVLTRPALEGATVALVGSGPGREIYELAAPGRVTVAPDVPDVGPWYAAARVAVVPLLGGGGTRIKVIEAMAHRRPVVSTAAGAEGLDVEGEAPPVVIADTADDFAAACRRLLDDPTARAERGAAGEAWVRARATIEVVAPTITQLALDCLGQTGKY